jgi:hypothetical protein
MGIEKDILDLQCVVKELLVFIPDENLDTLSLYLTTNSEIDTAVYCEKKRRGLIEE